MNSRHYVQLIMFPVVCHECAAGYARFSSFADLTGVNALILNCSHAAAASRVHWCYSERTRPRLGNERIGGEFEGVELFLPLLAFDPLVPAHF
jgi:hypothetical protein